MIEKDGDQGRVTKERECGARGERWNRGTSVHQPIRVPCVWKKCEVLWNGITSGTEACWQLSTCVWEGDMFVFTYYVTIYGRVKPVGVSMMDENG